MYTEHNTDLKPYNTFGLSSVAERLVHVTSREDLAEYFESDQPMPSLVLGGGSNMLLTRDIPGTVLRIELPGIEVVGEDKDHIYVRAGAGEVWHSFVMDCITHNRAGVENLSLIPGNVGAAPMQNIGAYGIEIKEVFHELEAYLIEEKCWHTFKLEDCRFGYRESIFKRQLKDKAIIASVTFRLSKTPNFNTSYGAIEAELEKMGVTDLSIQAVSQAVINIRQSKLPDPKKLGNAGSFFKNPVITQSHFEKLKEQYPDMVVYPAGETLVKAAAGWLIEKAGFKGKRFGNYGVHDRQALVLVNHGGATGRQIFELSGLIIKEIEDRFGITLEREVNIV